MKCQSLFSEKKKKKKKNNIPNLSSAELAQREVKVKAPPLRKNSLEQNANGFKFAKTVRTGFSAIANTVSRMYNQQ